MGFASKRSILNSWQIDVRKKKLKFSTSDSFPLIVSHIINNFCSTSSTKTVSHTIPKNKLTAKNNNGLKQYIQVLQCELSEPTLNKIFIYIAVLIVTYWIPVCVSGVDLYLSFPCIYLWIGSSSIGRMMNGDMMMKYEINDTISSSCGLWFFSEFIDHGSG